MPKRILNDPITMRDLHMRIASHILAFRQKMGISQEDFSSEVGLSINTVSRLETAFGTYDIPLSTIIKVAKALGVDASSLFLPISSQA